MAPRALVRDPVVDITVYPIEEKLGEDFLHRLIIEELRPMVARWLVERGAGTFVGADQFIYWRRGDIRRRVAPDVYVLPGVPADRVIRSWKTWEEGGIVPSFALEVVSKDVEKDYIDVPERYRELGVGELIIFDPDYAADLEMRFKFQVYRQVGKRGLVLVEATNVDRVRSKILACHIVAIGATREATRLRLGTGKAESLFPTEAERAEHERADKERERADKERERSARVAAEAEVARLRAELAARRRRK